MKRWILTALVAFVANHTAPANSTEATLEWSMVEVILQANSDFGVQEIQGFLSNSAYTAAIEPGLMPAPSNMGVSLRHGDAEAFWKANMPDLVAGLSFVAAHAISGSVFSVTVVADKPDAAEEVLSTVIRHLEGLRSPNARMTGEGVEQAQERLAHTEAMLEEAEARWAKLRHECSGMDPESWVMVAQERLQEYRARHWEMSMEMSIERGLREHHAARLAKIPAMIATRGREVQNPDYVELVAEMKRLRQEYEILLQEHENKSNKGSFDVKMKSTMRQLAELEAKMETTPSKIPGPDTQSPNHEYERAEGDLMVSERKLAEKTAQVAALESSIERVTKEVLKFQKLADMQGRLSKQLDELYHERKQAQGNLAIATREAGRFDRNAVQVVAGPSMASGR